MPALKISPRELDAKLHDIIFNKKGGAIPRYSSDIVAAWKLLRKMLNEWGGCFSTWGDQWGCVFGNGEIEEDGAVADDAPLAICSAAYLFFEV